LALHQRLTGLQTEPNAATTLVELDGDLTKALEI